MSLRSTHKPLPPLPDGWTEHKAPTGHPYYYNASTGQSTYTRPTAAAAPAAPAAPVEPLTAPAGPSGPGSLPWTGSLQAPGYPSGHAFQPTIALEPRRYEPKDRPKSKKAIPGAKSWVLVYTKLGRRFVHNVDSNESFWKFPTDVLQCVVELDRKERERKERRERGEPSESEEEVKEDEHDYDSNEYEEVEVTDDEDEGAASKRPRLDEYELPPTGPRELTEEDMAYQFEEEEDEEEEEYDVYDEPWSSPKPGINCGPPSEDDYDEHFRTMLEDFEVNPFMPWESIIEKGDILEDDRYMMLDTMADRREVWEEWSKKKIRELKEAKAKEEKKDPRIAYLAFLEKHATPKLYWPEFKRKFRKEPEMRDSKFSDKDREKLYREHINRLKLPESTLKADLSALLKSLPLADLNRSSSLSTLPSSLVKDVRYISLPGAVRDPLVEGFISMQPAAP